MIRINFYLIKLSIKYLFINISIISIFILFLNLIDLSRIINLQNRGIPDYLILSFLKLPSILNETLPFVTIIATSFLLRSLINNNELISMRNIGFSIFDIFMPIGFTVFIIGLFFLFFLNPLSSSLELKYEKIINKNEISPYSIKISDNEMWIRNKINQNKSSFINIKNIDLQNMKIEKIKILELNNYGNIFIQADNGNLNNEILYLNNVKIYNLGTEKYEVFERYNIKLNFNKSNILNSITNYKFIPFYNYFNHVKTLKKFNLYSPEIGLFYISEILKPFFATILAFVVIGLSGKFKRNENFFKVLFISILIGFVIYFLKEIINKITINLEMNFIISYLFVFILPLSFGLYQLNKIEND
tara:strand:- start:405 stop:1484 length:1080 start_codon:yes stop_codon:yes gene_type:complete